MNIRDIMKRRWGVTFITAAGEYHSYENLGILPADRPKIAPPTPKTSFEPVPGADGGLDLTESLTGYVTYNNRKGAVPGQIPGTDRQRFGRFTALLNILHGRTGRMILDEEKNYFYRGRFTVDAMDHIEAAGAVTINADLEPYKYEMTATDEDWLWDPFCFPVSVIRVYKELDVSGSRTVTVISSPAGGSPTIVSTAAMTMRVLGKTYTLAAGENTFPDLKLPHAVTEVPFVFTGTGTVTIRFRGGYL